MSRVTSRNEGQELVEFALVLPVLLLFVLGIVEFGMAVFAYNTVANAAREGARVGVVPSATEDDMREAVIARTGGLNLTTTHITATRTLSQSIVAVQYNHPLITGVIAQPSGGWKIPLRSVATMRMEVPQTGSE